MVTSPRPHCGSLEGALPPFYLRPRYLTWPSCCTFSRAEGMAPNDCQQELNLVRTVTQGPRVFLSREETQHFIKE